MKTLEISPLTPENFRIFGSYSRLVEPTAPGGGVNGMSFHPDMEILELGGAHAAAFSVTRVTSQLEPVIAVLSNTAIAGKESSAWTMICMCILPRRFIRQNKQGHTWWRFVYRQVLCSPFAPACGIVCLFRWIRK